MKKVIVLFLISLKSFSQIAIPDINFENKLIQLGYDNMLDGQIGIQEDVTYLDLSGALIQDLTGIEAFPFLSYLNVSYNLLTQINLSELYSNYSTYDEYMLVYPPLIEIDVQFNPQLNYINLSSYIPLHNSSFSLIGTAVICIESNYSYFWSETFNSWESFFANECGCTNTEALNFSFSADGDDGTCIISGCMDELACNYNELANEDFEGQLCNYAEELYDCEGNCLDDIDSDGVCDGLEIEGCSQDLTACNYNPLGTQTCVYPEDIYGVNYLDCDGNCVFDIDIDNICDEIDNCPDTYNPNQDDFDLDGIGDSCDGLSLYESQERGKLISVKDILGRGVSNLQNNEIRLYLYSDGRIEKKITKLK